MKTTVLPQDRLFPSDNEYEIPSLRLDRQPVSGLLLPFCGWGIYSRSKTNVGTFHFYVDDYRFNNIWLHPEKMIETGCSECVEPNFSLFDTTPIAYGMQLLYKKRWIARWLQECGIRIWIDLHVSPKFKKLNLLGVPAGYNAFATRGVADYPDYLYDEIDIARKVSGLDTPNMIVYGGGKKVRDICLNNGIVFVEQYMVDMRKARKEVCHG